MLCLTWMNDKYFVSPPKRPASRKNPPRAMVGFLPVVGCVTGENLCRRGAAVLDKHLLLCVYQARVHPRSAVMGWSTLLRRAGMKERGIQRGHAQPGTDRFIRWRSALALRQLGRGGKGRRAGHGWAMKKRIDPSGLYVTTVFEVASSQGSSEHGK